MNVLQKKIHEQQHKVWVKDLSISISSMLKLIDQVSICHDWCCTWIPRTSRNPNPTQNNISWAILCSTNVCKCTNKNWSLVVQLMFCCPQPSTLNRTSVERPSPNVYSKMQSLPGIINCSKETLKTQKPSNLKLSCELPNSNDNSPAPNSFFCSRKIIESRFQIC